MYQSSNHPSLLRSSPLIMWSGYSTMSIHGSARDYLGQHFPLLLINVQHLPDEQSALEQQTLPFVFPVMPHLALADPHTSINDMKRPRIEPPKIVSFACFTIDNIFIIFLHLKCYESIPPAGSVPQLRVTIKIQTGILQNTSLQQWRELHHKECYRKQENSRSLPHN